jgi:hypothetical protein
VPTYATRLQAVVSESKLRKFSYGAMSRICSLASFLLPASLANVPVSTKFITETGWICGGNPAMDRPSALLWASYSVVGWQRFGPRLTGSR